MWAEDTGVASTSGEGSAESASGKEGPQAASRLGLAARDALAGHQDLSSLIEAVGLFMDMHATLQVGRLQPPCACMLQMQCTCGSTCVYGNGICSVSCISAAAGRSVCAGVVKVDTCQAPTARSHPCPLAHIQGRSTRLAGRGRRGSHNSGR